MTNQTNHDYSPVDPDLRAFPEPLRADRLAPGKAPKRRRRVALPLAFAGTMVLGIALGSAAAGGTPEPETVTVEKRVEVPVETIVATTPAVCLEALDDAEAVVKLGAEALGYSGEAIKAAASFNLAGLESANADLETVAPRMTDAVESYNVSATVCRASN